MAVFEMVVHTQEILHRHHWDHGDDRDGHGGTCIAERRRDVLRRQE
jgi:hypothetical protein